MTNGLVLWEGPSALNGEPIVVIATGLERPSENRKTGPMIQTWILHRDVPPHEAVKTGADKAVCGDCKLRGSICYVTTHQAPLSVWRTYKDGGYPKAVTLEDARKLKDKPVRLGSYGDPEAAPRWLWRDLANLSSTWTGYTHQWGGDEPLQDKWLELLMASVDSAEEKFQAGSYGWRTFRVLREDEEPDDTEILCPATTEDVQCVDCGLCCGTTSGGKNIAIYAHGAGAKKLETLEV